MEKEFLLEKGVEFKEIDISESQEAATQMVEKTGQMGVPVTMIEREDGTEEVVVGFDQEKLTKLLSL